MTRKRRQAWSDFQNGKVQIFLVTIFVFSSFSCFWWNWVSSDWTAKYFSSLFCFISFYFFKSDESWSSRIRQMFFLSLYLLYYAQDSCKKWQENKDKLSLISQMESQKFLVTVLFLFFFWRNWVSPNKTAKYFSSLICYISFLFISLAWLGLLG